MDIPEQDKQALIEAARRRSQQKQGGAAFGIYPSSGKRPEKLNVSRDVNMPAQVARGWVAGTLGLPGDIESLGRLALGFAGADVSETPLLPTSEFYQEYLPGRDERPAAKFASGLGALAGGAGSTKLAGAAVKGAKATGKALGPKAAEMAEGYLQRSGLAPSVVKPKGGNWLSGSVERGTEPLVPRPGARGRPASETMREMEATYPPDVLQSMSPETSESVNRAFAALKPDVAVEDWINTKLNKYIRNEMGTPEDPVRKLAERDVLHFDPIEGPNIPSQAKALANKRVSAGMPAAPIGESELARKWETLADKAIDPYPAEAYKYGPLEEDFLASNPWLEKVPDEAMVYKAKGLERGLGFDHLIDELRNATRADSDLPANLRWKPEDLKKVTMEQAVERVAKINEYRAAKKAEANEVLARNPATAPYKDYETVPGTQEPNSKGLAWKQIKQPGELPEGWIERGRTVAGPEGAVAFTGSVNDPRRKALEDALKYEGDVMGHCVGGYCDDVLTGESQIYSLRDKKGEPHVTIEVRPVAIRTWDDVTSAIGKAEAAKLYDEFNAIGGYSQSNAGDVFDAFIKQKNITPPQRIVQIKGKGNAAPKAEYLPFVQDFVRSGKWSSVGDIQNTGMRPTSSVFNDAELQRLRDAGETNIPHILSGEDIQRLHNLITPEGRRLKYDAKGNIVGSEEAGYAKGGLVEDTDAIAAKLTGMDKDKALTHALRMANAKQEAHMAAGGLAKLLKGAKKAEDVAKPAQIGNYQALPLQLPRAPNLPPQELTKTAERVARQQMGEHVRKSATEAQNLAGRSMKEAERLKQLNIKLQPTKKIPTPAVVPEEIGQVRIALPGDISVADKTLMSIDDMPIGAPQEGGPMYGAGKQDLEDPRFWASNEGPAQIFQNKVTDLANLYETPEVLAQHLAMGHDAMNFAQHFADANLLAIQASKVKAKDAKEFDKIIKEGFEKINPKTKERVRITFPDFPGIRNYEEAYKATQENPELRKWFNNRMKVEKITGPLGLPSGKEVEYAIMEPALSNIEHSMTGLSVGRMKPGASLIPGSEHKTYSHDIAGQALGRTKELTPIELAFPDASAYIRGTKRPQDFTPTIQKLFPHQVVDDQYINQLGEYYNRLKQIRGYKKGGAVKKSGLSVLNKAII